MKIKNYYSVLGLDPSSTQEEIKKAYKIYASKFHPDKHQGDKFFEERFKEIGEAYEFLSDVTKKKILDDQLNSTSSKYSNEPQAEKDEDLRQEKTKTDTNVFNRTETPKEQFNREKREKRQKNILIGIGTTIVFIFLMQLGSYGSHVPFAVFFFCWTIRQAFLVVVSLIPD
ncbi:MAG: J domain-containing protein [Lewinellaceae bacterium]|nr:J domain-containing protein [Lewinellaceae bacterium]